MKRKLVGILTGACLALCTTAAAAGVLLQSTEYQVTSDANGHSTPMIGQDGIGTYIVYTQYPLVNGVAGNSDIYYQRVANGQPTGSPVVVANSGENQYLNDASGDYIVFTRAPAVGMVGDIVLFQISTGLSRPLTSTSDCISPRIYGNYVIWLERLAVGSQILFYDVTTGVPVQTTLMAGPVPTIGDAAIGDRFIAWSQLVNNQYDVAAYDMQNGLSESVARNSQLNEMNVETANAWITFETSSVTSPAGISIQAINMDTQTTLSVADNGASNQRPNVSGDLLTYESNVLGYFQVFVFRLAEGDTFQATSSTYDERLNTVFGNLVTYVDNRTGNYQVYASSLNFVTTAPPQPIANAGSNQTVHAGKLVTLDGSMSSDPSGAGLTLSFAWTLTAKPTGSAAALSNPAAMQPTFVADLMGTYALQLVVSDSDGTSAAATVTISTTNSAPVAEPGPDQTIIQVGTAVQLDGTQSYDPDGDPITYSWSFGALPQGSKAALANPTSAAPAFVADVDGSYQVQLVVSDPWAASPAATVMISFHNVVPVADAGASQTAVVDQSVVLDGTASHDANLLPLTYQWSFTTSPPRSIAKIANPTLAATSFVPDVPGIYIAQLVVADGFLTSVPATVQIKAISELTNIHTILIDAAAYIGSLDYRAFKNWRLRDDLIRSVHDVMADVERQHYRDAADDLRELIRRVDGCAESAKPDRDDWILGCQNQLVVYQDLENALAALQALQSQ